MAKSLFGGGAALTGALLLVSLAFNARPSLAENLASFDSTEQSSQKPNPTGAGLSSETSPNANSAAVNEAASRPETAAALKAGAGRATPTAEKNSNGATPFFGAEKYTATAYSLSGRTASGATVRRGFIAADHRVLPLGSLVRIDAGDYSGEYLVADRGSAVRGRLIDIWVPSTREAMRFGRRPVRLTVLSFGPRPAAPAAKARR
ncbi:MAG TPA: 3D domain-containing protein [Pyrinomonadaceae bacterium]|jgi:3D (Asp-Asp-Asp) domain-containing protein